MKHALAKERCFFGNFARFPGPRPFGILPLFWGDGVEKSGSRHGTANVKDGGEESKTQISKAISNGQPNRNGRIERCSTHTPRRNSTCIYNPRNSHCQTICTYTLTYTNMFCQFLTHSFMNTRGKEWEEKKKVEKKLTSEKRSNVCVLPKSNGEDGKTEDGGEDELRTSSLLQRIACTDGEGKGLVKNHARDEGTHGSACHLHGDVNTGDLRAAAATQVEQQGDDRVVMCPRKFTAHVDEADQDGDNGLAGLIRGCLCNSLDSTNQETSANHLHHPHQHDGARRLRHGALRWIAGASVDARISDKCEALCKGEASTKTCVFLGGQTLASRTKQTLRALISCEGRTKSRRITVSGTKIYNIKADSTKKDMNEQHNFQ